MEIIKIDISRKWHICLSYVPAVVLMALIFWFSSRPAVESSAESSRVVDFVLSVYEQISGTVFSAQQYTFLAELIHTPIRKLAHMSEYALLAWTVFLPTIYYFQEDILTQKRVLMAAEIETVPQGRKKIVGKSICKLAVISVLVCMCYAATDEFHQLFIEGRSGSVCDVLIDTIGAVLGVLAFLCVRKLFYSLQGVKRR